MGIVGETAVLLGAAALIAGLGTVSADAAVAPRVCTTSAVPDLSSAEYVAVPGGAPMWSGTGDTCAQVGLLGSDDVFDANCFHDSTTGERWIYGEDVPTGTHGWIRLSDLVKVGGGGTGLCANWV